MVDFPTPETQKVDKQNIANQMTSSKLSFIGFPGEIYRKPMAFTMVLPWNLLVSCRFSQENGVAGPLRRFAGSRVSPPKEPGSSWASQLKGLISKQSPSRGAGHRYDITFVHCTHTYIYIFVWLVKLYLYLELLFLHLGKNKWMSGGYSTQWPRTSARSSGHLPTVAPHSRHSMLQEVESHNGFQGRRFLDTTSSDWWF